MFEGTKNTIGSICQSVNLSLLKCCKASNKSQYGCPGTCGPLEYVVNICSPDWMEAPEAREASVVCKHTSTMEFSFSVVLLLLSCESCLEESQLLVGAKVAAVFAGSSLQSGYVRRSPSVWVAFA